MNMRRGILLLLGGILALGGASAAAMALRHEAVEEALIADVRDGGEVIYLRHAARSKGAHDTLSATSPWSDFADCSRQRNLTPDGREQARLLGADLRQLGVRIERVVALPLCRTRDTAILAFGRTILEPRMYDPSFVAQQLAQVPPPGTDTVLVGSEFQLRQLVGFQLDPSEMAIFHPDGAGGAKLVGRLKLEDWLDDWPRLP